jgi:phosphoribosylanthranilate isomerase
VKARPRRVIKVCGLRSADDVAACLDAGLETLGFNFYPQSPRYIRPEAAAELIAKLPPAVLPVGVFVRMAPDELARIVAVTGVRAAQLHGDEDPAAYAHIPVQRIQVLRVREGEALPDRVSPAAQTVLLDTHVAGFGGQGRRFDWRVVGPAREQFGLPVWIAGGITPKNVQELLAQARPDGVDVASGVESAPGVKDPARIQALVAAVRAFEEQES